ncbi:EamA family transporter [Haloarchaeobius sp. DYHT-AS-18]|uniref:EamA family transporter n=1 Tax=Haloarchaeobius sp. DYHT-AS-18 TaxID=3446117 RepID=UPI003EBD9A56
MSGIAYALFAAVLFGVYLFVVKRYFSAYPVSVYLSWVYVAAVVWYLPIAFATTDGVPVPTDPVAFAATVAVSLGVVVALVAFFRALAIGEVSYVAPISKVVPAFVLPIEVLLLQERLTPMQVAGVVVVTIGLYLVNYEPGELLTPLRRAVTARPAQLALVSAATFGVVDVGKRVLLQELAVTPTEFVVVMLVTILVSVVPLAGRKLDLVAAAEDWWKFVAVGAVIAGGQHVIAISFTTLPASVASPIVNAQAVVAVLLGGVLLDEPQFRIRLVAASVAIAGVALITLG